MTKLEFIDSNGRLIVSYNSKIIPRTGEKVRIHCTIGNFSGKVLEVTISYDEYGGDSVIVKLDC